jgi:two-component system, chemotaxis family, CheB/CheR fusion protein
MQAIVGLGGSAGSIGALKTFFTHMPGDSGFAFVVVLHLSPASESLLAGVLQKRTPMPVIQVSDPIKVEANCVYVIPPGKHLLTANGQLVLKELPHEYGKRTAVDIFFRSLADTHEGRSIAIVLSGVDGDGAIGIKRIKEKGGITVAQEPGEAQYKGMPRSAIDTGMVDWVLPVAEMPRRLLEYQRTQERVRLPKERRSVLSRPDDSDDEKALRSMISLLRAHTGHDFSFYNRKTILRRIGRRMRANNIEELSSYLTFLRLHPHEVMALRQDLLAPITNFFRDQEAFDALAAELPKLFADKFPGDQMRVWVPGCATGEEAYSIAILLSEGAAKLKAPLSMQVFATDLDQGSINVGRAALYPETITADVSEERLRLFFFKEPSGYRLKRNMRETMVFALQDLLTDPPFSCLDLISCRNLLIYFDRETQRRVSDTFRYALRRNGILFLGTTESIQDPSETFTTLNKKYRLYAKS